MTILHLLRHGEHGLLGRVLAGRMPGVGMTERGRAEIAAVAERLAKEKVAAIYASPLQRTRESAEIVAERLRLPIAFRDDLIELDFGEWTGATFDSIRADPRWQAWSKQRSPSHIPGGDSLRAVQQRAAVAAGAAAELRPHLLGDDRELLDHDFFGRGQGRGEIELLHARVLLLDAFEESDEVVGRAGEPGAEPHEMLDLGPPGRFPAAAPCHRRDLLGRQPGNEAQGREHLDVLFVERDEPAHRLLAGLPDIAVDAEHQIFAEL